MYDVTNAERAELILSRSLKEIRIKNMKFLFVCMCIMAWYAIAYRQEKVFLLLAELSF
jgi:hypothetical protein